MGEDNWFSHGSTEENNIFELTMKDKLLKKILRTKFFQRFVY